MPRERFGRGLVATIDQRHGDDLNNDVGGDYGERGSVAGDTGDMRAGPIGNDMSL